MKRRGLRATLTAGAIGLAVVAGIVAFNWGIVRDHAEAWWFQATRETVNLQPDAAKSSGPSLLSLANLSGLPVIYDATVEIAYWFALDRNPWSLEETLKKLREEHGFRILEQRFPRRAYVVVGYPVENASGVMQIEDAYAPLTTRD